MPNHVTNVISFTGAAADIAIVRSLALNPATDESIEDDQRGKPFVDFGVLIPMPEELKVSKTSSAFSDLQRAFAALALEPTDALPAPTPAFLETISVVPSTEEGRSLIVKAAAMGIWPKLYQALTREASRLLSYDWMAERLESKGRVLGIAGLIDYALVDEAEGFGLQKQYLINTARFGHADWYSWSCANWGTKWNAYDGLVTDTVEGDTTTLKLRFDTAWSPPEPWFGTLLSTLSERLDGELSERLSIEGFAHDEGHGFWCRYTNDGIDSFECDGSPSHEEAQIACYGSVFNDDSDEEDDDTSDVPDQPAIAALPAPATTEMVVVPM
jgi:hypothetical protein